MKTMLPFFASILVAALAHSQGHEEKIKQTADRFSELYVNGDHRGMAEIYTEDAVLMSPGQDMIYGREAIYKFWSRDTTYHQVFHKSKSDKLEIIGDTAFDNGFWYSQAIQNGKKGPLYSGKYLIIWKKNAKGDWQMYHDIWNNRAQGWEEREKD